MSEPLHTKYRPLAFEDVVGQEAVVTSLSKIIERGGSHAFLFAGPSGTGKTTLARICAETVGCSARDVLEIDAATYTGIEAMRQIQQAIQYMPFGKSKARGVIVDECHSLSRQSWQSLLKSIEEPPAHVFWFFCTTEPAKVPATIKTRCTAFTLKSVPRKGLEEVVEYVCGEEAIKLPEDIKELIISEAQGSVRQALVNLEMCRDITNKKKAADVLRTVLATDPMVEFCRFIIKGGSWAKAMTLVEKLGDENPESVRIMVCNWIASALKNSNSPKEVPHLLEVLDAFSQPYNPSERSAPLLLSIGRVLFGE